MQQTKNYKLNLIETSDTFSPAPLNENAEKTEAALAALHAADTMLTGAVAAAAAENCLVKLLGPMSERTVGEDLVFDLSKIDTNQFTALLILEGRTSGATIVRFGDGSATHTYALHSATAYPSAGFTLLMETGENKFVFSTFYTSNEENVFRGKLVNCTLDALKTITFTGSSHVTLYGIRA